MQVNVPKNMIEQYISVDNTDAEQNVYIDYPTDGVIIDLSSLSSNYVVNVTVDRMFYSGDASLDVNAMYSRTVSSQCTINIIPTGS